MKRTKVRLFSALILPIFLVVMVSGCDKDENPPTDDIYNISATMNGANEKPNPVVTGGTGTTTGTYNATTNTLQYNVTWTGLSGTATVGHFHGPAAATATASPVIHFNLINSGAAGSATGTIKLTDAQETDFLGGLWYTNIHTVANGAGEIRGQVAATK